MDGIEVSGGTLGEIEGAKESRVGDEDGTEVCGDSLGENEGAEETGDAEGTKVLVTGVPADPNNT